MKPIRFLSVLILALIALAHLARLVLGVDVVVEGVQLPLWVSGGGVVIFGLLAFLLYREKPAS